MDDDIWTRVVPQPEDSFGPRDPIIQELIRRWRLGERPTAQDFLKWYPELNERPEAAVGLIYEEMCLRQEYGLPVRLDAALAQFPQWREQIELLWECHGLLDERAPAASPDLSPASLADYVVLEELGRGSQGTVYLAKQVALGDRAVVVKISPDRGQEHLTLARLQHAHIVPLYAAHAVGENKRVLCMPYFGGLTLQQLLQELSDKPVGKRRGADIVAALDRATARAPTRLPAEGPARALLARASYVQAVCWIGVCLAEALRHAHERDCIHLDLKPSNVLLAADGTPMLLDFHIAQQPLDPDGPAPAALGGTPLYMSPEQRLAVTAMEFGQPVPQPVDGRSDLFSLGLVLYEALGGTVTRPAGKGDPELDLKKLPVSPGLNSILGKCLAPRPERRYQSAAELADDLRRYLNDLPLRGVPDRHVRERWQKWRRRRPHALPLGVMTGAVLAAALALALVARHETGSAHEEATSALAEGRRLLAQKHYAQAVQVLQQAAQRATGPLGDADLLSSLQAELDRAHRALAAEQLHTMAERFRFLAGADAPPAGDIKSMQPLWQKVWDKRDWLLGADLAPDLEQRLRTDLLDLALIWAGLRVRLAGAGEKGAARQEALAVLTEAEQVLGQGNVLLHQKQLLVKGTDDASPAAQPGGPAPKTISEYLALGRWYLQSVELDRARGMFVQAVEEAPQNFWANFYLGVCAYRQNELADALTAFQVCVALAPDKAEAYYNRGLVQAALEDYAQALNSYDRALELRPDFAAAALNRGLLHYRAKRYDAARADFERALETGHDPAPAHYNLALVHLAQDDRPACLSSLRQALQADPSHQPARKLLDQLISTPAGLPGR